MTPLITPAPVNNINQGYIMDLLRPLTANINRIPLAKGEWSLFIDDVRVPPGNPIEWRCEIVRSYKAAVDLIEKRGYAPVFISFDHDLADKEKTGYDFAKWLVNKDLDAKGKFLPKNFSYVVHSMNPVGAKNIDSFMSSYLRVKGSLNYAD